MGNCQAIDNATLLIQHPNGRVDKLYVPITASEIMKINPGHYVALLLTTTFCPSAATTTTTTTTAATATTTAKNSNSVPVRITRIKLLRPTDTLVFGHVYRLVTTQEVMKGLRAKKYGKMKEQQTELAEKQQRRSTDKLENSDFDQVARRSLEKNQVKCDRHRIKVTPSANQGSATKSRTWQPALHSISEAGS